jgi:hypothetical protein
MWRPETPVVSRTQLIEELRVRAVQLRASAAGTDTEVRAAEALRQWADDLDSEVHALVISSWGGP